MDTGRAKELVAIKKKISRIDPAFTSAIKNLEPCAFGLIKPKLSQYQSLIRAVIAQQVSTAAARTITGRLETKCAGSITAEKVGALTPKQLQSVGLTGAKVRTISELTAAALSGEINFRKFAHMSDEEAGAMARSIWHEINGKNLVENIEPTKSRASLIVRKGADHRVTNVNLRRL